MSCILCCRVTDVFLFVFCQRPEKLNEKPSLLPAVEVIAPGGSYNPDFFSHQVTRLHLHEAASSYNSFNHNVVKINMCASACAHASQQ